MAALSAIRFNPAVRALYARVVAKHPEHKAVAVGHAMRKLLHLVFAVWKGGRPFDPDHYPWQAPAHVEDSDNGMSPEREANDNGMSARKPGRGPQAGRDAGADRGLRGLCGQRSRVGGGRRGRFHRLRPSQTATAAGAGAGSAGPVERGCVGAVPQRRCACPLHRGDARGRTFSVNLDENVFQCFDARCGKKGDVIDLWAAVHGQSLRAAALDLVRTFGLEPAPRGGTEKRNG